MELVTRGARRAVTELTPTMMAGSFEQRPQVFPTAMFRSTNCEHLQPQAIDVPRMPKLIFMEDESYQPLKTPRFSDPGRYLAVLPQARSTKSHVLGLPGRLQAPQRHGLYVRIRLAGDTVISAAALASTS